MILGPLMVLLKQGSWIIPLCSPDALSMYCSSWQAAEVKGLASRGVRPAPAKLYCARERPALLSSTQLLPTNESWWRSQYLPLGLSSDQ